MHLFSLGSQRSLTCGLGVKRRHFITNFNHIASTDISGHLNLQQLFPISEIAFLRTSVKFGILVEVLVEVICTFHMLALCTFAHFAPLWHSILHPFPLNSKLVAQLLHQRILRSVAHFGPVDRLELVATFTPTKMLAFWFNMTGSVAHFAPGDSLAHYLDIQIFGYLDIKISRLVAHFAPVDRLAYYLDIHISRYPDFQI